VQTTSELPVALTSSLPGWAQDGVVYISEIWNQGAYGFTYGQIITILAIILFSLIIRGIFSRVIVRGIARAASGTETQFDDALVKAVATPLRIVPVILGIYFALQYAQVDGEAAEIADRVLQSAITLAVFWTLSRTVNALEFIFVDLRDTLSPAIIDWLVKLLQIILIVLGFGAVAQIWGIAIAPLIAGLGVFGIAVGLGAQDLFKNLIAGILIMSEKRFHPGEWIKVDGVVEGTVEKINFRSTLVRRFDKSPVFVPNAKLADNPVTNFSRMSHRRIKWVIGVEYRTSVEQLKYIRDEIEAWLWNDERFAKPPEAALFVRVDRFNDSSIDFLIYCFTHSTNWGEWLAIKEEFAMACYEIIERAGTGFAFPSRTVYMQQQDAPEIVPPPMASENVAKVRAERAGRARADNLLDEGDG
jgi:MscS family membrane protein